MMPTFEYFQTPFVKLVQDAFVKFAPKELNLSGEKGTGGHDVRRLFFRFFQTDEFKSLYEKVAVELAEKYQISENDFLIQPIPTPRVFRPGDHGTSWHTDYWYGHGSLSRTVWVPISGAVKGATFSAIKNEKDNAKVVEFYEKNPSSLINSFELLDSKIVDVCPPKNNLAIFSSKLLHGSPENTTNIERLSFDFRFTPRIDTTSTKKLSHYLCLKNKSLHKQHTSHKKNSKFLKYICGGKSIDTAAQHILIDEIAKNDGFNVMAQEAEIERLGNPMLLFHAQKIKNNNSKFHGIIIATSKILNEQTKTEIKSKFSVPIYCALERQWL